MLRNAFVSCTRSLMNSIDSEQMLSVKNDVLLREACELSGDEWLLGFGLRSSTIN